MSTITEYEHVLRVVRPDERATETASGAIRRDAAISRALVGAQRIWFGYAQLGPSAVSAVHHHGEAESGMYIVSGDARFFTGPQLEQAADAHAGDFVWVPPHLIHVEANLSAREPVRMVVARSTQDTLNFNLPTPEGWTPSLDWQSR